MKKILMTGLVGVAMMALFIAPSMAQNKCVPFDSLMKKYNVSAKEELFSFCSEGERYSYFKLKSPQQGKKYLLLSASGGAKTSDICGSYEELVSDADYKTAKASFKAGRDDGASSLKKTCWH